MRLRPSARIPAQALPEYALLLALMAVIVVGSLVAVGGELGLVYVQVAGALSSCPPGTLCVR